MGEDKGLLELVISKISNLTSSMDIYKEGFAEPLEIVEFSDEGLGLEIKESSCQLGHLVTIDATLYLGLSDHKLSMTGKIESMANLSPGHMKVTVKLHNFDSQLWSNFILALRERQEKATQLFKAIKGEE